MLCHIGYELRGNTLVWRPSTQTNPRASPLWRHPNVTVTPHNAAISDPEAIADLIAAQITARRRGGALRHVVDRGRAY